MVRSVTHRRPRPLQAPPTPFELVLVEPEIPPNTGNVARLCACTGARLHLVCPLGFSLTDKDLRRAGLDYWDRVHARTWGDWSEFEAAMDLEGAGRSRLHLFTASAARTHVEAGFRPGDLLVFGRESRGLPEAVLEKYADRTVALPMMAGSRSLNLSSSASIALYEALRQAGAFAPAVPSP
jgi:tRNA (cytidine/uridine-2'-O-)-methyltransferase